MRSVVILLALASIASQSNAETSPVVTSELEKYAPLQIQPSIASQWGLSPEEAGQYERVRQRFESFSDAAISPLEVLGMNASSPSEKRRYAEMYVRAQGQHVREALEWGVYVEAAAREIQVESYIASSPTLQASLETEANRLKVVQREWFGFDKSPEVRNSTSGNGIQAAIISSRGVLFVKPNCVECDTEFQSLRGEVESGQLVALDVVFAGMKTPDRKVITEWAARVGVTPSSVRDRKITLNYEGSNWAAMRNGKDIPYAIRPSK